MLRGAAWATTVIRSGVDAKDDPHLIIVDLDPPDQGADEIAPGSPVRRRQPVPDHPGEALEPTDDQLQRSRPRGGVVLGGDAGPPGRGAGRRGGPRAPPEGVEAGLELRLVDDPVGVAVDEAADAA